MLYAILLTLGLGAFTWIAFRSPRIAFPLFIALLPTYLIRFSLGPLPTTFLEVSFFILFGSWLWRNHKEILTQGLGRTQILLGVLFCLVSFTSLAVIPREHLISSLGLWRAYLLEPFLFGLMAWHALGDQEMRVRAFLSLVLSGFVLAVLGIFQYTTQLGIPAPWDIERRITSVFDYPNALGLFLAPVLSALLVFGISTWKRREQYQKIFIVGVSMTLLLGIVLAKTEAALVAIPAALFFALLLSPLPSLKQKTAGTCLAIIALFAAFCVAPIREKLLLQDYSGGVRLSQRHETILLLRNHPLTGAGFGYYSEMLRSYHQDWQYEIFQDPHNILLNIWVEMGLLGVVLFVVGFFSVGKNVWKRRDDALVFAAGIAIFTMCVHGLVDVPFFKNDLAMLTAFFVVLVFAKE